MIEKLHLKHHVLYLVGKNKAGFIFKRISTRTEDEAKKGMPDNCVVFKYADVEVGDKEMKITNEL